MSFVSWQMCPIHSPSAFSFGLYTQIRVLRVYSPTYHLVPDPADHYFSSRRLTNNTTILPRRLLLTLPLSTTLVSLRSIRIPQDLESYSQTILYRKLSLHCLHHDARIRSNKRKGEGLEAWNRQSAWKRCSSPLHNVDHEKQGSLGFS